MNITEANKIVVDEDTVVSQYNGEEIYAGSLQKWAYRRLETFPELLEALNLLMVDSKGMKSLDVEALAQQAIAKAEGLF